MERDKKQSHSVCENMVTVKMYVCCRVMGWRGIFTVHLEIQV